VSELLDAVLADGRLADRVWVYADYHCNLACTYCLTSSSPSAPRRELGAERIRRVAEQAAALGFRQLGVTGGEPFLLPYLPETLAEIAETLPVLVLSNGTLFGPRRLARLDALVGRDVTIQISLDQPDPVANDEMRGPKNFARVVEAIPRLVERGIRVRIATTLDEVDPDALARLCDLHRSLGVADEDHVVRPIVARGRASEEGLGVAATPDDIPPELTITTDGAFWSPFGPTVRGGRVDSDLLVTRTTDPLRIPAEAIARLVTGRPPGEDSRLGIR
jgi:MoaA/NifB/PqqE/SkfB family radical SAM enzyme